MDTPQFSPADPHLLARYTRSKKWTEVPPEDQQQIRDLWQRLKKAATWVAAEYQGQVPVVAAASHPNPSGRTATHYWSCIYPQQVEHKSYGLQVALIITASGAEVCFCLGAGKSDHTGKHRERLEAALTLAKYRLGLLPPPLLVEVKRMLSQAVRYRRRWLSPPGPGEFSSLDDWLEFASSPEGNGASVSVYFTPEEIGTPTDNLVRQFLGVAEVFASVLDYVYGAEPVERGARTVALPTADQRMGGTSEVSRTKPGLEESSSASEAPEGTPRLWVISPGEGARLWDEFHTEGIIAIGWNELGDLRQYQTLGQVSEAIQSHLPRGARPINDARACFDFVHTMRPGDHVFAKRGRWEILAYGVVASEYRFEPRREYAHVRSVNWKSVGPWRLAANRPLPVKTLTDLTADRDLSQQLRTLVQAESEPTLPPVVRRFSIEDALKDLFIGREKVEEMLAVLRRKRNLILAGPPGVGKTFVARRLAYALLGEEDDSRVEMVQFHQSYGYEDFIQGWRPAQRGGFERRDGIFYKFCVQAQTDGRPYVFVIDEINRANLSKVLGELMVLIEADKRGEHNAIPLMYSRDKNERFYLPENLYLIGMMNTADRSLAMVDYALRRRFGFVEVEPAFDRPEFQAYLRKRRVSEAILNRILQGMLQLNQEIVEDKDLGHGFEIGHSFFVPRDEDGAPNDAWLQAVLRYEVEPLLREYWFEGRQRVAAALKRFQA